MAKSLGYEAEIYRLQAVKQLHPRAAKDARSVLTSAAAESKHDSNSHLMTYDL